MNQEKIGKFIAKNRKAKNLTQDELALNIGVTNKAISRWENGHGLPDPSVFNLLCKELDISINELLNGEDDTKKNENEGYVNYLKYSKRKNSLKLIILSTVFIFVIILMVLGIFFLNNYGKTTIYKLHGNSENFSYNDGILTVSGEKIIFSTGDLKISTTEIDKGDILSAEMYADNLTLASTHILIGGSLMIEDNGYNEIFTKDKLDKLNKWVIKVRYVKEDSVVTETINVKNEIIIKTNKLFNKKVLSIGIDENYDDEIAEKYNDNDALQLKSKLLKDGFKQVKGNKYHTDAQRFYKVEKEIDGYKYTVDCYYRNIFVQSIINGNSLEVYYEENDNTIPFSLKTRGSGIVMWSYYVEEDDLPYSCKDESKPCPVDALDISRKVYKEIKHMLS